MSVIRRCLIEYPVPGCPDDGLGAVADANADVVVGRTGSGGKHSRCFALSGDGKFVILAHSNSRNVVVRRIDSKTGVAVTWWTRGR
jgi:hypothetical protein